MKRTPSVSMLILTVLGQLLFACVNNFPKEAEPKYEKQLPTIGAWFWGEDVFKPNGYEFFIDHVAAHSPYNLLTTSIRVDEKEITSNEVHNQVQQAVQYANKLGIEIALDLDVRLARRAFEAKYPEELQEMLHLQEVILSGSDTVETVVRSIDLSDHMTSTNLHYIPLRGSLLRVYAYNKVDEGIDPNTLVDITSECKVVGSSKDSVVVRIPEIQYNSHFRACVMVSFTHLTPAVFAPHLLEFQREIIRSYADIPLAGGMKDEWGFPPTKLPSDDKFWYSKYRAQAYAKRTGGRELLSDCLLMHRGINGQEGERQLAINHLMEMNWKRNGALEDDFYHTVKEVFGLRAVVVTHATWYAYLCEKEYKKNALSWWVATRDWAQTDEEASFAVRTSLAKKWNSPVWYNQYYATEKESYQRELWSSALAGGRVNYHPIYPNTTGSDGHIELLRGNLMQGESRVRLLNYIARTPLDCPVAVIFGHAGIMNWAGPSYDDPGVMELINELWCQGIPTDLIPSSEIESKSLFIDEDGWICYGAQRYSAIVLYNPEFENGSTADFFNQASIRNTKMYRIGDWTRDFNGKVFIGEAALPSSMGVPDSLADLLTEIQGILNDQQISPQSPAVKLDKGDIHPFITHPTAGFSRLIDGTLIQVAGTENVSGDQIQSTVKIQGHNVFFDAIGIAAVRLNNEGQVEALVAGGLKSFKSGPFEIYLEERTDIALWIDTNGKWEGVIQGWNGEIPPQLLAITKNWNRLDLPLPLSE